MKLYNSKLTKFDSHLTPCRSKELSNPLLARFFLPLGLGFPFHLFTTYPKLEKEQHRCIGDSQRKCRIFLKRESLAARNRSGKDTWSLSMELQYNS